MFVGWTPGSDMHTVKLTVSLFGSWENWILQPLMTGDPICQYASVCFHNLISVGLAAGQYIDLGNGAYVHLTVHNDILDRSICARVDAQLRTEFPPSDENLSQAPKEHMDFWRRILAGKKLDSASFTQARNDLEMHRLAQNNVSNNAPRTLEWASALAIPEAEKDTNPPRKQQKLSNSDENGEGNGSTQ